MKKSSKLFVFVLFALVLSIFVINFASAAPEFLNKASDIFTNWEKGNIGENITKYLVWAMITLLLFAIMSNIPLLKEENMIWVRSLLSILVGFLSIAYLTPQDLFIMLASYNALGVVLAGIVPFVLMVYFSVTITKDGNTGTRLFSKFAWVVFILYLIYKVLWGWSEGLVSGALAWVYVALIVLGIIYTFVFERKILDMMFKKDVEEGIDRNLNSNIREAEAKIKRLRGSLVNANTADERKDIELDIMEEERNLDALKKQKK